jgi:hypothetical protein
LPQKTSTSTLFIISSTKIYFCPQKTFLSYFSIFVPRHKLPFHDIYIYIFATSLSFFHIYIFFFHPEREVSRGIEKHRPSAQNDYPTLTPTGVQKTQESETL